MGIIEHKFNPMLRFDKMENFNLPIILPQSKTILRKMQSRQKVSI